MGDGVGAGEKLWVQGIVGVGGEGWRAVAEVVGMGELRLNAGAFEVVRWQDLFDQRVQKSCNVFMVVIGEYRDF